ncbi:MAG: class I SAM-dependent methyltransferase [Thermoplasmata archaeon]
MSEGDNPVIKVPRDQGQKILKELKNSGRLDSRRAIKTEADKLIFPVKANGDYSDDDPKFREENVKPYLRIKERLDLPDAEKEDLPENWEKIGNVLLIKLPERLKEHKERIAEVYAEVLQAKTVMLQGKIKGIKREPEVEKIYGEETETVHLENGIRYKLDTSQLMFSSGNIDERIRMAEAVEKDDVVVDMFAGIGYFSLPMAVHGEPDEVFSLEINPTAYHYLKENIRLNSVEGTVQASQRDNRDFSYTGAERVVMGYLHQTWKYLDKAVEFLDGEGIIHYHTRSLDSKYPEDVKEELKANLDVPYQITDIRQIKSYAPHVFHVVVDLEIVE